ncbi:MAG: hypothetical protein C0506_07235 [Anaerolinea sp.]|nr:hypothetical protein [Anaerolinea sp.]
MKVEYDPARDLLYVWFAAPATRAARTQTLAPGVNVDFDRDDHLVGIEVLDARQVLGPDLTVEFAFAPA